MKISIDRDAGFCFGVQKAIVNAENYLRTHDNLYCLGDIVHNENEIERLQNMGLKIIDREEFNALRNVTVLIRAHGEPSDTYDTAIKNNISLIDATCPLVLRLQKKIEKVGHKTTQAQIIIYGKPTHPEVIGLQSKARDKVIVVNQFSDLDSVDFAKPIKLFSQTTKDKNKLFELKHEIQKRINNVGGPELEFNDTICKQVHNRNESLKQFCKGNEVVLFVGGKKSSNARVLFSICKSANPKSYFISTEKEINTDWLKNTRSVGISGATSTPDWLLNKVKEKLEAFRLNEDDLA